MVAIARNQFDMAMTEIELALAPPRRINSSSLNNRDLVRLQQGKWKKVWDINTSIMLDPNNGWAYRNKEFTTS